MAAFVQVRCVQRTNPNGACQVLRRIEVIFLLSEKKPKLQAMSKSPQLSVQKLQCNNNMLLHGAKRVFLPRGTTATSDVVEPGFQGTWNIEGFIANDSSNQNSSSTTMCSTSPAVKGLLQLVEGGLGRTIPVIFPLSVNALCCDINVWATIVSKTWRY